MYYTNFYLKSNQLDITRGKGHTPTPSPSKMIEILLIESCTNTVLVIPEPVFLFYILIDP